jgi:hypothetical protein
VGEQNAVGWARGSHWYRLQRMAGWETEDAARLRALRRYRVKFEKKWRLDERGQFRRPTWYEKWTRTTLFRRLEKRVRQELRMAAAIESELGEMATQDGREVALLQYARLDFLNRTERRIYMRFKVRRFRRLTGW